MKSKENNKHNIFEEFELFPEEYKYHINELVTHVLGEETTGILIGIELDCSPESIFGVKNRNCLHSKCWKTSNMRLITAIP